MKKLLIIWFAFLLIGCSSLPTYRPAKGDAPGYKEIMLGGTDYRVQFKLRGHNRKAALNYALQRSAELTLQQGYDWFVVTKKTQRSINSEDNFSASKPEAITTTRCGILRCHSQTHQIDKLDNDMVETYSLVLLDIHMGRGIRPEKESYDAQEFLDRFVKE